MATSKNRTQKVRFSPKTFATGLAKSTGSAIAVTISSHAPFMSETITKFAESVSDASKFVKENNPMKRNKNKDPILRRVANDANSVFDNLKEDFVTGDMSFEGTKEVLDSFASRYSDDEWEFGSDDPFSDDDTFDDGGGSDNPFSSFNAKTYADGVYATATAITQSSRVSANAIIGHNYKAMKAMSNKMISSNMAGFAKINVALNSTNNRLDAINNNIISLVEFNNTTMNDYIKNMTEHMAKQQAFMDNMLAMMTDVSNIMSGKKDKKSKIDPDEYNFVKGGFDPKKFVRNFIDNSQYGGMAATGLSALFKAIFGKSSKLIEGEFGATSLVEHIKNINPLTIAIETLFPALKGIDKIDKSAENLMKVFFAKAKEGTLGGVFSQGLLKSIMKEIGFSPDYFSHTLSKYDKEALAWTGQDSMALQTVIPTYLANIDAGLKNMEDSLVGAINSVTDTITLYGEIFRTGDKTLTHRGGKTTVKKFKNENGDEVSVSVRDYSKDYATKRKFERELFDFKEGSFKAEKKVLEEKQNDVVMLFQSAFSDALGDISGILSKSTVGNAKKKALKDTILEKMLDFDMYDTPKTLKDSEVADITEKLKQVKSDISDREIAKFINDFNVARFNLAEKHMTFADDNYNDSLIRILQDKVYMGSDEGKKNLFKSIKDTNAIQFMSLEDVFADRLANRRESMTAEERARLDRENQERERANANRNRVRTGFQGIADFFGIGNEDGNALNRSIAGGLNRATDFMNGILGAVNGVPQHASGALNIERDKIVKVHKGEIILPPDTSEAVRENIEKFIRGETSDIDESITGKATAEVLRHVLRGKNHKKVSSVSIATQEMWESEEIKKSSNLFEWFTYKLDEIGENLKIIGQNSIERVKEEAKKIDENNSNGINHSLSGEKNEDGYYEDGIASKILNKFILVKNKAMYAIRGTAYTDNETGEKVRANKEDSFIGKYKKFLKEQVDKASGALGVTDDTKKNMQSTVDFLAENTDKAIIGGAGSLIASALLGVSINPILGAGAALALSHDKIKDKLFGTKDPSNNGKRQDNGLISQEKQKFIKDNIFKLVTGGIAGIAGMNIARNSMLGTAATSLVGQLTGGLAATGGLGGIVGGILNTTASLAMSPLAGALIGVGGMALLQSEGIKKTLFGEEVEIDGKKVRQGGIFGSLKKSLHKVTDAVSAVVMGEKYQQHDEDGNEITVRRGGILGALKNAVSVHVIEPIKDTGSYIKDYFEIWFKNDVIGSIGHIVDPIAIRMENFADGLMDGVKGVSNQMLETIKKALSPLTSAVKNIGDALFQMALGSIKGVTKMTLGIASAPLKTLAAIMNIGNSREKFKAKINGIRYDIGIFKDEFKEFHDRISTIWLGDDWKDKQTKTIEKLRDFVDADKSPLLNLGRTMTQAMKDAWNDSGANSLLNAFKEGFSYIGQEFKKSKFYNVITKGLGFLGNLFGKAKSTGKNIFNGIFGGLGDRILHPFKSAKDDFDSGFDAVENFKSKASEKYESSIFGRFGKKVEATKNAFGGSFKNTKDILRWNLGIGMGSPDSGDRDAAKERLNNYLTDKYGFVDTQSITDELDMLTRSGIKTQNDRERVRALKNELNSYNVLQNRINKEKRKLSKKYGYNDDDFNNLSTREQEKIRERIAKISGIDTSEWTSEDIAKFAHGTKGDKKKDDEAKKVQEATLQVPAVIKEAQTAIVEAADARQEVVVETVNNVENAIKEGFMGSNNNYMEAQKGMAQGIHNCFVRYVENGFNRLIYAITGEKVSSTIDQGLFNPENYSSVGSLGIPMNGYVSKDHTLISAVGEVVDAQNENAEKQIEVIEDARDDQRKEKTAENKKRKRYRKKKEDEAKIAESQGAGKQADISTNSELIDEEVEDSEEEGGKKKQGLLSKLASIPMKLIGGAVSGIKGIGSLLGKYSLPITIGVGAALAWPLLKKIPWGTIIKGVTGAVGKVAKTLISGAAHVVTEVVPTLVTEVVKNIPDMVSTLVTSISDGVKTWWDDHKEEEIESNTYVNSEGETVESDLTDVDAGYLAGKAVQNSAVKTVTKSATKTALNNTIGKNATSALGAKLTAIATKIKDFLRAMFKKNLKKSAAKKIAKSKIVDKFAKTVTKGSRIGPNTIKQQMAILADDGIEKALTKIDDVVRYITKDNKLIRLVSSGMEKLAKKAGYESVESLVDAIAPVVKILSVAYNAITGAAAAERYFHLRHATWPDPGDADATMMLIAATFKTAENEIPVVGTLASIFFDVIADISTTNSDLAGTVGYDGDLRCRICTELYIAITKDSQKELKLKTNQVKFVDEVDAYNEKFGTSINATQMARGQNMFLTEHIFNSSAKISNDWENQDVSEVVSANSGSSGGNFGTGDSYSSNSIGAGGEYGDAVGYGHYVQNDPRWSRKSYGRFRSGRKSTIGSGGCGPTALANAINNVTGANVTNPVNIAKFAANHGYGVDGGTSAGLFNSGANKLGVRSKEIGRSASSLTSQLRNGNNIIISGKGGSAFTSAGHIMTVKGVDGRGNAVVDDPLRRKSRHIPFRALTKGMTHAWSIGRGKGRSIGYGTLLDNGDNYAYSSELLKSNQIPVYNPATNGYDIMTKEDLEATGVDVKSLLTDGMIYGLNYDNTPSGCYLNSLISAIFTKYIKSILELSLTKKLPNKIGDVMKEFAPIKVKGMGYASDIGTVQTSGTDFISQLSTLIAGKMYELNIGYEGGSIGQKLASARNTIGDSLGRTVTDAVDVLNTTVTTASLGTVPAIIDKITGRINDSTNKATNGSSGGINILEATEYGNHDGASYPGNVVVDMVSGALAGNLPVVIHTNKDIDSNAEWQSWRNAVFGNRSEHAVLLMGAATNGARDIADMNGYVLIGDPGSDQVSKNGYNTSLTKGGQVRLVPLDYFMHGLRTYGPSLNHVLPIGDTGNTNFVISKNSNTDVQTMSNADTTQDGINAMNARLGITATSVDGSSTDSNGISGFTDYIASLGERLSKVAGATLDWLFTGEFKNPFADEAQVSRQDGTNVYDAFSNQDFGSSSSSDTNTTVQTGIPLGGSATNGLKPSGGAEQIIQAAYAYAAFQGQPFNTDSNSLTIMVLAAEIINKNSKYLQKYRLICDGKIKLSISPDGFAYNVLKGVVDNVGITTLPTAFKTYARIPNIVNFIVKGYSKAADVDNVVDAVIEAYPYNSSVSTLPFLGYDGLDLSGYGSFATKTAGYSDVSGGYISSKLGMSAQRDLLGYVRRMTSWDETGQDPTNPADANKLYYDPVHLSWNNEHSITIGRHGFYADNAAEVLARLANAPISDADKQKALQYARDIKNHKVSDTFRNELAAFVQRPEIAPYVKHIEDAMSVQFSDFYMSRILPQYDSGVIKDPRSVILGAEFAGVAPYKTGVYYENLNSSTSAAGELDNVYASMTKHYSMTGWKNRIGGVYGALKDGYNKHLNASFSLPKSIYDMIPTDANDYTGSVGYGTANTMRNSMSNVPVGYGFDDVCMGDADNPINVTMDSSPITRRLDAILSWLEELTKEYPEKAGPVSGYGSGDKAQITNTVGHRSQSKALGDNDHIINGTARDKLRALHNTLAARTRA